MPEASTKPAVIVISSHVARGGVGNRAAVFALETLGFPVWAVPTIQLPWHPGHGPATRLVPEPEEFASFLADIAKSPWINEVGAVLTGYMANTEQVEAVANLVSQLKSTNPDLLHLCDPVIGDFGGLYVTESIAAAIRDRFIPICDIATPNRFELGWLLDSKPAEDILETRKQAELLSPQEVLVTSTPGKDGSQTGNLMVADGNALRASHASIDKPPNGPGDLTAAIHLGHCLSGISLEENLAQTTASVFEILQQSIVRGSNELTLAADSQSIIAPRTVMDIEHL